MPRQVVVIGAGITGALLAARLAKAGWRVTVLEGRHVGAGSSSRTAAGIRQQFSTPETVVGMRFSVDFYRRFREEVGGGTTPIVQNGYLFLSALAEDWEAAQARVAMQHAVGLTEVEALSAEDLAARFGWIDRFAVLGGTWCPTDGFLRPDVVYNEAISAAIAAGATVVQNAPVVGVADGGVVTPKGRFNGDFLVDCTNAWSPRLSRILGATELPIAAVKRYLWVLDRGSGIEVVRMPLVIAPSGAYCRPENADSLLVGWAHDAPPEPEFSYEDQDRIEPAFWHRGGTDTLGYEAWASLAEVLPPLGDFAGISATTCGYYGTTPDHNPFLGFDPAVPNLLHLAGFSGHGAMFGPFSALVGAALLEAGHDLASIEVLGHTLALDAFRVERRFARGERMVI